MVQQHLGRPELVSCFANLFCYITASCLFPSLWYNNRKKLENEYKNNKNIQVKFNHANGEKKIIY